MHWEKEESRLAEQELGWNRGTIRKGQRELESGIICLDAYSFDEIFFYGVISKVTSDCLVDRLVDWWETVRERFSQIKTIVINADNGLESHSRRTQFMQRLLEFAQRYQITVRLAYYPPYHSKYNPVERCWGILEQHWNGALLDSVEAVIQYAKTMAWKGKHPVVELVTTTYQTGVKLTKEAMDAVETHS